MKKTKIAGLIALAVVPAGVVYAVMDDDGHSGRDRAGFHQDGGRGGDHSGDQRFPGGPGGAYGQPGMGGPQGGMGRPQGGPPGGMGTPASASEAKKAGAAATKRYPGTIERVEKLADGSFVVHVITKTGEQHVAVSKSYKVTGAQQGGRGLPDGSGSMKGQNGSTSTPPAGQRAS